MSTIKNIRNCSVPIINVAAGDPILTDVNAWHINGNEDTGISNYVGTTDNTALILATNGDVAQGTRFNTDGSIDFLNNRSNIMLGYASHLASGGNQNIVISNNGVALMVNRNNNILIGTDNEDLSQATEDNRIIIGNQNTEQTFIKGIAGNTPGGSLAATINSFGAMGQVISTKKAKKILKIWMTLLK